MAQMALYREWRPMTFEEVVGQQHVTSALRQAVVSGQLAHAWLFSGTRGTGKTTMAKILARAVNCLDPQNGSPCNRCEICREQIGGTLLDVAEIDAASNNSVENVRQIIDEIVYLPTRARYKVYIIDEVHMLSPGAFNALLKTLEEPPAHALFILATTDPQRLPATILSRCQRYDFHRIGEAEIVSRLRQIAVTESISIDDDAIRRIAILADGALRDAISLLDQASISYPEGAGENDILDMAGRASRLRLGRLLDCLAESRPVELLSELDALVMEGYDIVRLAHDLAAYLRDLLIVRAVLLEQHSANEPVAADSLRDLVHATDEDRLLLDRQARLYAQPEIVTLIQTLAALIPDLRWSSSPRTLLEITLIQLLGTRRAPAAEALTARETALPAAAASSVPAPPDAAVPAAEPAPEPGSEPLAQPELVPEPELEPEPAPVPAPPATGDTDSSAADDGNFVLSGETTLEEVLAAERRSLETRPAAVPSADWQAVLDWLREHDMFAYLFARPAQTHSEDGCLVLRFARDEGANYNVFSSERGAAALQRALAAQQAPLHFRVECDGQRDSGEDTDPLLRLKRAAVDLGIRVIDERSGNRQTDGQQSDR